MSINLKILFNVRLIIYPLVFLLFAAVSCTPGPEKKETYTIKGRDGVTGYLCSPPAEWDFTPAQGDLQDSTLPLATWTIDGTVTVVIHNFPGMAIPPGAQIARWQRQLKRIDPSATYIEPVAWGGFAGLEIHASEYSGKAVLGWAMSLPTFHRYSIQGHPREEELSADWTIKATGPADAIASHENAIRAFAHTFRLKHEIPSR